MQISFTPVSLPAQSPPKDPALWAAAEALEASFLSEMLKASGVGAPRDSFGGGAGEAPFAGFLTDEYARAMAAEGGIGLAEAVYRGLVRAEGGA